MVSGLRPPSVERPHGSSNSFVASWGHAWLVMAAGLSSGMYVRRDFMWMLCGVIHPQILRFCRLVLLKIVQ